MTINDKDKIRELVCGLKITHADFDNHMYLELGDSGYFVVVPHVIQLSDGTLKIELTYELHVEEE